MPILSAQTMIRSISLFHMTLAALLIKNPSIIAKQSIVLLLSQSMQLPTPRDFAQPSATTAFLALLFAFIGVADLTAISLSEPIFDEYWGNQAPVRVAFLFVATGYTFVFKQGGMFAPRTSDFLMDSGASIHNSIVFTWGFFELAAWMWVYTALRAERTEKVNKVLAERKAEEDRL